MNVKSKKGTKALPTAIGSVFIFLYKILNYCNICYRKNFTRIV